MRARSLFRSSCVGRLKSIFYDIYSDIRAFMYPISRFRVQTLSLIPLVNEDLVGPTTELYTTLALQPIAYGDDDIEVVENQFLHLCFPFHSTMPSGMCKFCTHLFPVQFSFLKHIVDVSGYNCSVFLKQLGHLRLRKPQEKTISPSSILNTQLKHNAYKGEKTFSLYIIIFKNYYI